MRRTVADDESAAGIAGYAAAGAFVGMGIGAAVGALLPSGTRVPFGSSFVRVDPVVPGGDSACAWR